MRKRKVIVVSTHIQKYGRERPVHVRYFPYADEVEHSQDLGSFFKTHYELHGPLAFQPVKKMGKKGVRSSLHAAIYGDDETILTPRNSVFYQQRIRPVSRDWRWGLVRSRRWQSFVSMAKSIFVFDMNGLHAVLWLALTLYTLQWIFIYVRFF
jgi:hypothetical protein